MNPDSRPVFVIRGERIHSLDDFWTELSLALPHQVGHYGGTSTLDGLIDLFAWWHGNT